MKIISVPLKERSYNVCVGARMGDLGVFFRKHFSHSSLQPKKALIISNPFLLKKWGGVLVKNLGRAGVEAVLSSLPAGEKYKNLDTVQYLYRQCVQQKLDRTSAIIALGGGVIGDMAGFVAATYLRGIALVHLPTTLLAMVDSSIGGKTGVDLPEAKNFVGAFYQPAFVWIDVNTLKSLPEREFRSGLAEVIKYGVIADEKLFRLLEKESPLSIHARQSLLADIISRCVKIKAEVVSKDERETRGLREILNFGHTWGHAVETVTRYRTYKHGEAISIGMSAAGFMSEKLGLWRSAERIRMENLLSISGLPVRLSQSLPRSEILKVISRDKKNRSGTLRFVLPLRIGRVTVKALLPHEAAGALGHIEP